MISVICCYNDPEQYARMAGTLKKQDADYELIGIDNCENRYSCAAAALNLGGRLAKGNCLAFVHQDILFERPEALGMLCEAVEITGNAHTVAGPCGAVHGGREKLPGGLYGVDTLDEYCIAMRRETWQRYRFDERLCDGWHLYAAELCLRVKETGGCIAEGHFPIRHLSIGNVDERYMRTFRALLKKYKSRKWICTTCKSMPTNMLAFYAYYFPWKIKKLLLGNYPLADRVKRLKNEIGPKPGRK